ncbi:hypothetical protein HMPREF0044_1414 [Gleimia coleocanis DSM 15436]|uniref:Uncharacterized protein n=1 Tax=Gleimia coleocanis DSM 15436 TaxID=525245 RepID=C0W1X4_9ACTO|nr:hypothetical protein [Gleimia coleocanis]EEH63490.1 hypothetical protein HMPREF0044_1414 [Gleimia coleocanis DSM 15436]
MKLNLNAIPAEYVVPIADVPASARKTQLEKSKSAGVLPENN